VLHLPTGTYLELDATATEILTLVTEVGEEGAAEALSQRYRLPRAQARADVAKVASSVLGAGGGTATGGRRPTRAGTVAVIRSWWRLPPRARVAVVRATILVATIEIALHRRPLDQVARRLGVPLAGGVPEVDVPPLDPAVLSPREELSMWASRWVLEHWLFDATCLRRSLAWGWALRSREPALCVGLLDDGKDLAHAWLHLGGASLDARDDTRLFSPVGPLRPIK
jgi:hypothetical protein